MLGATTGRHTPGKAVSSAYCRSIGTEKLHDESKTMKMMNVVEQSRNQGSSHIQTVFSVSPGPHSTESFFELPVDSFVHGECAEPQARALSRLGAVLVAYPNQSRDVSDVGQGTHTRAWSAPGVSRCHSLGARAVSAGENPSSRKQRDPIKIL
jgi:hypothetical protein